MRYLVLPSIAALAITGLSGCRSPESQAAAPEKEQKEPAKLEFDDYVCPDLEDLFTKEILEGPLSGLERTRANPASLCAPFVRFRSPEHDVIAHAYCGAKNHEAELKLTAKMDPTIGLLTAGRTEEPDDFSFDAWDDDT